MKLGSSSRRLCCLPTGGSIGRLLEALLAKCGQQGPSVSARWSLDKIVQGKVFLVQRCHVRMCDPHRTANIVRQISHLFMGLSFAPTELSFNKLALLFHTKSVI